MLHKIKCWPKYFQSSWVGRKTFEIRENDRNYRVDDEIVLEEWDPAENDYTGRSICGVITYITDYEQKEDYVVFQCDFNCREE